MTSAERAKLEIHRALSSARLAKHGLPPSDAALWWSQISAIAAEWGVETKIEDWTKSTKREPHQVAA